MDEVGSVGRRGERNVGFVDDDTIELPLHLQVGHERQEVVVDRRSFGSDENDLPRLLI